MKVHIIFLNKGRETIIQTANILLSSTKDKELYTLKKLKDVKSLNMKISFRDQDQF